MLGTENMSPTKKRNIIIGTVVLVVLIILGIIAGYKWNNKEPKSAANPRGGGNLKKGPSGNPAVGATGSASITEKLETEPEKLETETKKLETEPEKLETEPEKLETEPEKLETEPADPAAGPADPAAGPADPAAGPADPASGPVALVAETVKPVEDGAMAKLMDDVKEAKKEEIKTNAAAKLAKILADEALLKVQTATNVANVAAEKVIKSKEIVKMLREYFPRAAENDKPKITSDLIDAVNKVKSDEEEEAVAKLAKEQAEAEAKKAETNADAALASATAATAKLAVIEAELAKMNVLSVAARVNALREAVEAATKEAQIASEAIDAKLITANAAKIEADYIKIMDEARKDGLKAIEALKKAESLTSSLDVATDRKAAKAAYDKADAALKKVKETGVEDAVTKTEASLKAIILEIEKAKENEKMTKGSIETAKNYVENTVKVLARLQNGLKKWNMSRFNPRKYFRV